MTPELYTLSLHDALPILVCGELERLPFADGAVQLVWSNMALHWLGEPLAAFKEFRRVLAPDRKSTRLNSSHLVISYAVFCLKKKNNFSTSIYLSYTYQSI